MTHLSKTERIELARDAQQHIEAAIDSLKAAVQGLPCEKRHLSYLICGLECAAGAGDWLVADTDPTVAKLIEDIENEAYEDDLLAAATGCIRNAGYAVRVAGDRITVSLTNRRVTPGEIADLMHDRVREEDIASNPDGSVTIVAACA